MNKQTDEVCNLHEYFYFIKMKANLLESISLIYVFKALTYEAKENVRKMISANSFPSLKALV